MSPMNRWQALALLTALPCAARLGAQIRPTLRHRVILGVAHGFLLEPGGTVKAWLSQERSDGLTEPGVAHVLH